MERKKRKFGITNPYYNRKMIDEDLSDDIKTLGKIFSIFNEEFFNNELEMAVISIDSKLKKDYEVTGFDHYEKHDLVSDNIEQCIGIHFSDKVLRREMKDVALTVLLAMIYQKDMEDYQEKKNEKIGYSRGITNNGNYFSKAYKSMCEACGLNAKEIVIEKKGSKSGKGFSGKYEIEPNERFNEVFNDQIKNYKMVVHNTEEQDSNKGTNYLKTYKCTVCGLNIMIKRKESVKIGCYNTPECNGKEFVIVEKERNREK